MDAEGMRGNVYLCITTRKYNLRAAIVFCLFSVANSEQHEWATQHSIP